jgi:hypothetical protein
MRWNAAAVVPPAGHSRWALDELALFQEVLIDQAVRDANVLGAGEEILFDLPEMAVTLLFQLQHTFSCNRRCTLTSHRPFSFYFWLVGTNSVYHKGAIASQLSSRQNSRDIEFQMKLSPTMLADSERK